MYLRRLGVGLCGGAAAGLLRCVATNEQAVQQPGSMPRGTAIVTGGGRGIGAATSKALAEQGYGVVIAYRSDEAAAVAVRDEIQAAGGAAVVRKADVSKEADVVELFEFADGAWGARTQPLSVLINNAGFGFARAPLSECTAERLHAVIATNVAGPLICCREAERRMSTKRGGKGGSIVQVSSGAAYIGMPYEYAMSKGALNSLTTGLVKPLAEAGIRINTVSPGMTATDMVADQRETFDYSFIPMGRWGTPEEIASVIAFLCSDGASYVAGANVRVAGGRPPGTTLG